MNQLLNGLPNLESNYLIRLRQIKPDCWIGSTDERTFATISFPPVDTQSISFTLYARFQQREGQRIETERALINFVQLAHRGREKRKKRKLTKL